ncbi:MAG: ABC transporter permease, partial [Micrococcales bacterium]|nr:ABC transporter permease [Micrococcales bacterium]
MGAGIVPVLAVIFASGAVPFNGASLVPFAGIVIGGTMNAHSLAGRRVSGALREQHEIYEAALALGLYPRDAVDVVALRLVPEALVPGTDQTRTVGLVTLPGAFVGVLLGGGTPIQAATAQVLVLVGLLTAQTITVGVGYQLMRRGRLVPPDLRQLVPHGLAPGENRLNVRSHLT